MRSPPYFRMHADSPNFNRLFAAMYDVFFSKLTNMGRLVPDNHRTLADVFKEKIYGTDKYLVSAEIIAYLKWLIYVAAFKDRGNVAHELFYNKELGFLKKPSSAQWRAQLYKALEGWYNDFKPSRKRKSVARAANSEDVVDVDRVFKHVDNFDDNPWGADAGPADDGPLAGRARAPAAAAAVAAAAGGGAPA